ncbi:succinate dehydrogenase cytochrome b small subunit [Uncinocarpus reesii 1704]|uniref:Succinate dehydrogenase cytochrome b small subunit n=1 Tax=Uncinocarpus reesii (strain UAMH 1704) TaxID=336963 RepID=C4JI87_UNCRE|nr:succinate dehydrogenase cytochrome b small subunit [Uncinocarpus reesii 1704]EEP77984.1 succinate dehydrogenase cytochrome b small subunit [Uncinocarpus reesii 1704]
MATENRALIYQKVPTEFPIPGEHLTIEKVPFDEHVPDGGVTVQSLYTSFDPYMRGGMRPNTVKSYRPPYETGKPLPSLSILKVLKSNNDKFKPGDVVLGFMPIQEYVTLSAEAAQGLRPLENPLGLSDLRYFLGALGMPGLTAYSSLMEIGKPKKGETIFISSAAGAVGQVVGQIAKHEGLKRLAPEGLDIYYENVGGEHLEAAIDAMNDFGRIVACGMISQYNLKPEDRYPVKNIFLTVSKRLTIRGFIVSDPGMGDKWANEHRERVSQWIKEGSFRPMTYETAGIENAPKGLAGFYLSMASIIRPSAPALRQTCITFSSSARRAAFYSTKSPFAAIATVKPVQLQKKNGSMKIAQFHATSKRDILPPEPQVVKGTVNDAAPIPPTSPTHGSYHWDFERLVAISLIPLTITPFAAGSLNPVTDAILCGALVLHSHIGFQALIVDYLPARRVPKTRALCVWALRLATLTVAVGLYEFETNDVGITEAIKRIWKA